MPHHVIRLTMLRTSTKFLNVNFNSLYPYRIHFDFLFLEYKFFYKLSKIELYIYIEDFYLISIFNRTMCFYLGSKRERHVVEAHPRTHNTHAFPRMYTRRNPEVLAKRRDPKSKQTSP